ncbi:cysteine synthase family protein [Burkholderia pseudomallei]|uniref:cysteine synthase family protein n=1 Tax=Burkholderia pseudomallei TaxID=28450 RepID=UPI0005152F38|nr:cysteine synthase family protein [Burkholderia pseudomallei]AIS88034.1 pyridoxal-phosphate dependent enzyme family protein [Burkholderia pseudomallei NAU35A-3]OMS88234.1 cysteine synthase [Burkholderia pseudomallei]OMU95344.1 cysteine synthase [Burkholderia pseudomallei]OMV05414.1 cysteine synthase [Burkholderia pseudomallei]OMW60130.1 cysteine synthase [Burkholderia pseudomallei]
MNDIMTQTFDRPAIPVYDSVSGSLDHPDLIRLAPGLVAAAFRLMKLVPAKYIIENAIASGQLNPGMPVLETSSGTFAMGIGIVCAEKRIPFHIVSDAAIDERLQARLRQLGGRVQIVGANATGSNVQVLRLEALQERLRENPGGFWPRQYDNPDNQHAYRAFAAQLIRTFGTNLTIVGTVGSGASTCGTIRALREVDPSIPLVGVDTFGSVLFGLPVGPRALRGLGNSIYPNNLDHTCFDQVHWVAPDEAFGSTRRLHRQHGLYCGPTSGAAFMVAEWLRAQRDDGRTIVFIAPDEGHRYADTVYDDAWLRGQGYAGADAAPAAAPVRAVSPNAASGPWAYVEWGRRTFEQASGRPRPAGSAFEQIRDVRPAPVA